MPVQLVCPSLRCRKLLSVPEEVRGLVVRCAYCQTTFRVPTAKKPGDVVAAGQGDKPQK
jgi:LSD1 subclass zinc finger protein